MDPVDTYLAEIDRLDRLEAERLLGREPQEPRYLGQAPEPEDAPAYLDDGDFERWLHTRTYVQLQALRSALDRAIQRYRDNARPADAVERVGRGRMYLPTERG